MILPLLHRAARWFLRPVCFTLVYMHSKPRSIVQSQGVFCPQRGVHGTRRPRVAASCVGFHWRRAAPRAGPPWARQRAPTDAAPCLTHPPPRGLGGVAPAPLRCARATASQRRQWRTGQCAAGAASRRTAPAPGWAARPHPDSRGSKPPTPPLRSAPLRCAYGGSLCSGASPAGLRGLRAASIAALAPAHPAPSPCSRCG